MSHEATVEETDIKEHVSIYIKVFVALAFLTVVTVGVASLHLSKVAAITVALAIATIKGSLVACWFMHLISEKKLIYGVLIFTVLFFLVLLLLPALTNLGMTQL